MRGLLGYVGRDCSFCKPFFHSLCSTSPFATQSNSNIELGTGIQNLSSDRSIFYTILVESSSPEKSGVLSVVGMRFFYIGFSASNGKYLYLEGLFIREKNRGAGCGKSIMYSLADIALKLNCHNFIWQALDWNAPTLTFYQDRGEDM